VLIGGVVKSDTGDDGHGLLYHRRSKRTGTLALEHSWLLGAANDDPDVTIPDRYVILMPLTNFLAARLKGDLPGSSDYAVMTDDVKGKPT